jgi:uncharacterized protein YjbI with pentapeptide repeats
MAKDEHLSKLLAGVETWNKWREENRRVRPDLKEADLREANLAGADLRGASLQKADLHRANLSQANLRGAKLRDANLYEANFQKADLGGADLKRVNLRGGKLQKANIGGASLARANLSKANFRGADLSHSALQNVELGDAILDKAKLIGAHLHEAELARASFVAADLSSADLSETDLQDVNFTRAKIVSADFSQASVVRVNLDHADLTGCRVYGCSVWDVRGEPDSQRDLLISQADDGDITTDDIEVAQFIYLMYDNKKIRNVVNSITSKGVLILGRFSPPDRKEVLNGLRDKLREFDLLPIVFDFDRPTDKDYTETVQTLAGMSMFVIVDVTNPKSTPLEMEATVKQFKIPFIPIIDVSVDQHPFSMIVDLQKNFHWVLKTVGYRSKEQLLEHIDLAILERANEKHKELRAQKQDDQDFMVLLDDMLKNRAEQGSA